MTFVQLVSCSTANFHMVVKDLLIRFNRPLSMQEMEQVILDLQKCKQPYHCPHGRPTVIVMSDGELRKEFERG